MAVENLVVCTYLAEYVSKRSEESCYFASKTQAFDRCLIDRFYRQLFVFMLVYQLDNTYSFRAKCCLARSLLVMQHMLLVDCEQSMKNLIYRMNYFHEKACNYYAIQYSILII